MEGEHRHGAGIVTNLARSWPLRLIKRQGLSRKNGGASIVIANIRPYRRLEKQPNDGDPRMEIRAIPCDYDRNTYVRDEYTRSRVIFSLEYGLLINKPPAGLNEKLEITVEISG